MFPLSLGWGLGDNSLVTGLGSCWHCPCHGFGAMAVLFLSLYWYYSGVTLITSCHWVGDLVPLSLSLNLEQSGAILVTRLGSWQCHLCQCVWDVVVSSLSLCWFHGGVILVTSCHQAGDVVVSPLSSGWEYGGVTLVTGLGTWWHLETWWDDPCPCHHGDDIILTTGLGP